MKRDRYESDYERVRRQAGLARSEFPEPDTSPRQGEVGEPQPIDDGFRDRMAELARLDAEKAAERKIHADALTLRANELVRLKEYQRAGVDPMPGGISLSLALQMGWKIEQVGDRNVLVQPGRVAAPKRMTREEHAAAQSDQSLKEGF